MLENGTREETLELLLQTAAPMPPVQVPPHEACGLVLAEEVRNEAPIPDHARSSRDGYALDSNCVAAIPATLPVRQIFAPGELAGKLEPGTAARILTGAPLPDGADTVVMDEDVQLDRDTITLHEQISTDQWIFRPGNDLAENALVGTPGDRVTPGMAAVLTRCGRTTVRVHPAPSVSIFALGNELATPDEKPAPGGFRSENLVMASALLEQAGARLEYAQTARDTGAAMREAFTHVPAHGLTVSMGGTGKGDHDLARSAAREAGFTIIADGVRLRPGRTMFAAKRDQSLLLGLPGPPFAVAPLLFAFALPLIGRLAGAPRMLRTARMARPLNTRKGLEWLAPCSVDWNGPVLTAIPLAEHTLSPLAEISRLHGYIAAPPDAHLHPGDEVPVLLSGYPFQG